MASMGDSAVWTLWRASYVLELWTLQGKRLDTIRREVPWFRPWRKWTDNPLPSVGQDIQVANGLVWTLIGVPNPVSQAADSSTTMYGKTAYLFHTVIEVFNPATHQLMGSYRPSFLGAAFLGNGIVAALRETAAGEAVVDLWRISLIPRHQRRTR